MRLRIRTILCCTAIFSAAKKVQLVSRAHTFPPNLKTKFNHLYSSLLSDTLKPNIRSPQQSFVTLKSGDGAGSVKISWKTKTSFAVAD